MLTQIFMACCQYLRFDDQVLGLFTTAQAVLDISELICICCIMYVNLKQRGCAAALLVLASRVLSRYSRSFLLSS